MIIRYLDPQGLFIVFKKVWGCVSHSIRKGRLRSLYGFCRRSIEVG